MKYILTQNSRLTIQYRCKNWHHGCRFMYLGAKELWKQKLHAKVNATRRSKAYEISGKKNAGAL